MSHLQGGVSKEVNHSPWMPLALAFLLAGVSSGCDSGSSEKEKKEGVAALEKATGVASTFEGIMEAYVAEERDAASAAKGWEIDEFSDAESFRKSANSKGATSFDVVSVGIKGGFPEKGKKGGDEMTGAKMLMQIATVDEGPKLVDMGVTNRISGANPLDQIPEGASAFRALGKALKSATQNSGVCKGFPIASSSDIETWIPKGTVRKGLLDKLEYAAKRKRQHCDFVASMDEGERRFRFGFDKAVVVAKDDSGKRVGHALIKNKFGSFMTLTLPKKLKGN